FDIEPDPGAVVLWFSDDPSLNDQSRARIHAASSELDARLRVVPTTFAETSFRPGKVYFLNTQKLSRTSRLVRSAAAPGAEFVQGVQLRPDIAQSNNHDTSTKSISTEGRSLYMTLEEAHGGIGTRAKDRATIVQRLINGHRRVPPIPVVFGISATVERFD